MIELSDDDRRAMFDELMDLAGAARKQESHQFTVREFAETEGIHHQKAARVLEQLWARGILDRDEVITGSGRRGWAYWKKEPE